MSISLYLTSELLNLKLTPTYIYILRQTLDYTGVYIYMKNILYAQIGNAVQHGIFNAISQKMSLKDSICDAQYMFKYNLAKKTKAEILNNLFFQIESMIKRGYYEFVNFGKIKSYQKINLNKKNGKITRLDFEFSPKKNQKIGTIVELKCTWNDPRKISKKIIKQMQNYKKNTTKNCMICFLKVNISPSKTFINCFPYWYLVKTPKKKTKKAA